MAVKMKDIAERAGVSVGTVSRAFNDKPDIDEETKQKILDIADELHYRPNAYARSLRAKRTRTIGIIIPDISDPVFAEILLSANKTAKEQGYQTIESILANRGFDVEEEIQAIQTMIGKRIDGLLLQPEHEHPRYIRELRNCPIPYVLMNRNIRSLQTSFVTHNHEQGAYLAISHLLERRHREICFIVRYPRTSTVQSRINGCCKALREAGLSEDALQVVESGDSIRESYRTTLNILTENGMPTALFVWEDIMALGAIRAITEKGLRIPDDVAVVGYNDMAMSAYFSPPLTTIRQKISDIGAESTRVLINELESDGEEEHIIIEPELIVRETT